MKYNLDLLKQVLSVPTATYKEDLMIEFLQKWLSENNIPHYTDSHGNVYATKENERLDDNSYHPCVVCHTDTVHGLGSIVVKEEQLPNAQEELKLALKGYTPKGKPTGIGGDDKCGVFACLTLLKELPNLKAAFFVSEETGCHGSRKADKSFFNSVGYAIQFDAPENWMITEKCFGHVLFDRDSPFFEGCDQVLTEGMNNSYMQYMVHPYTDVYALRSQFDFSCINFSIGYYNYHSDNEYVVVEDVFNGIDMGKKIIEKLGNRLYHKPHSQEKYRYVLD